MESVIASSARHKTFGRSASYPINSSCNCSAAISAVLLKWLDSNTQYTVLPAALTERGIIKRSQKEQIYRRTQEKQTKTEGSCPAVNTRYCLYIWLRNKRCRHLEILRPIASLSMPPTSPSSLTPARDRQGVEHLISFTRQRGLRMLCKNPSCDLIMTVTLLNCEV